MCGFCPYDSPQTMHIPSDSSINRTTTETADVGMRALDNLSRTFPHGGQNCVARTPLGHAIGSPHPTQGVILDSAVIWILREIIARADRLTPIGIKYNRSGQPCRVNHSGIDQRTDHVRKLASLRGRLHRHRLI